MSEREREGEREREREGGGEGEREFVLAGTDSHTLSPLNCYNAFMSRPVSLLSLGS